VCGLAAIIDLRRPPAAASRQLFPGQWRREKVCQTDAVAAALTAAAIVVLKRSDRRRDGRANAEPLRTRAADLLRLAPPS